MDEIKKLSGLDDGQVDQAVGVFVDGFHYIFSKAISKDKEKLHLLFKNSFDYDMTYAYLREGEAVGFMGLGDHIKRPIALDREVFLGLRGGLGGKISYKAMSAALGKVVVENPDEVYVDYLATSPEHRSQGIGTKLIEYVRDTMGYKYIKLEVLSKNPRAKKLYESLGFEVIKIKTDIMMMINGFGKPIIMRMEVRQPHQY